MESNEHLAYLLGPPGAVPQIGRERGRLPRDGIGLLKSAVTSPGTSYRYVYVVADEPVAALQVMVIKGGSARVANVFTAVGHRRAGYATKLYRRAERDFAGCVGHSDDLSGAGLAWKNRVSPSRENPMPSKFDRCVASVERSAAERGYALKSARGVCAAAGRRRYGAATFAAMSAAGRRRARSNPTAAIRSWHRKGNVLVVHDLDIDDAVRVKDALLAPGYVLRVDTKAHTFALRGAMYAKGFGKTARWKLEREIGKAATGATWLDGSHATRLGKQAQQLSPEARRALGVLIEWLVHETVEHGRLPPPRPNPCGCTR